MRIWRYATLKVDWLEEYSSAEFLFNVVTSDIRAIVPGSVADLSSVLYSIISLKGLVIPAVQFSLSCIINSQIAPRLLGWAFFLGLWSYSILTLNGVRTKSCPPDGFLNFAFRLEAGDQSVVSCFAWA